MDKVGRRRFLERAGATFAAGTLPLAGNAAGGAAAGKEKKNRDAEDPARFGVVRSVVEWSYAAEKPYADPFNDVELDVVFTDPQGHEQTVPAFWAGEQTWRIRYSPVTAGRYTYRPSPATTANCTAATACWRSRHIRAATLLRKHGPIRVAADQRHFEHEDGTPFFWLGDTWWMGLCSRMRWPEDFQQLAADRVKKGFTVIQIIAGLVSRHAAL